jgi:hypothetical protein
VRFIDPDGMEGEDAELAREEARILEEEMQRTLTENALNLRRKLTGKMVARHQGKKS